MERRCWHVIRVATSASKTSSTPCTTSRCWNNDQGLSTTPNRCANGGKGGRSPTIGCCACCARVGRRGGVSKNLSAFSSSINSIPPHLWSKPLNKHSPTVAYIWMAFSTACISCFRLKYGHHREER